MVTNVTSLTRSGLSDFVIQRVSAVLLTVYPNPAVRPGIKMCCTKETELGA